VTVHATRDAGTEAATGNQPTAALLRTAFENALTDPEAAAVFAAGDFTLQFVLHDPDTALHLGAKGVTEETRPAALLLETDLATLLRILTGRLGITQAVIDRRLTVRGPVAQVRRLGGVLPAVGKAYAALAARPQAD
jgi:putative sterol carrier protein